MWLAIQTAPRQEARAIREIGKLAEDVYCPMRTCLIRHGRIIHEGQRPLFPGYAFAYLPNRTGMHDIRNLREITGIVGGLLSPSSVPQRIIDELRAAEALGAFDERPKPALTFQPGESVRIIAGPLNGFVATVLRHRPGERVHVLLTMLGGDVRGEIRQSEVERV